MPRSAEDGGGPPVEPLPQVDFWQVLYQRRSIRKFTGTPVPRELIDQVMHAGIWAPSSCNYQMWDLVAVTDPARNAELAALSAQMGNAPVNIVVAYGRDFSEENFANIQSASALIQNMSLAAHALGLGTFWITQTGGAEKVRKLVGLPEDRFVVAVLALGFPKITPKQGPKRRPLEQVTHYNHYAGRPIPSSTNPEDWEPDLLAIYQRARVLNGLRHNKPRPWEQQAIEAALKTLVPGGQAAPETGETRRTWLDVLPCTGIWTETLSRLRRGFAFDVAERSPEVARFCADRAFPPGQSLLWPAGEAAPTAGHYDMASILFRLEGLRAEDRAKLLADVFRWLKPGGQLLLGYVSKHSFHGLTEALRARRGGPRGVEYVLAPDPGIGPFAPLDPEQVQGLGQAAGFQISGSLALQKAPTPEEIEFRTRNMRGLRATLLRGAARTAGAVMGITGDRRARFQFLLLQKPL
ncbi:MAG: nitroreductase family protein [Planctomycetota bacterium]